MYDTPKLTRFGTVRDLTQAGCSGLSDGVSIPGIGTADGDTPSIVNGTTIVCFSAAS